MKKQVGEFSVTYNVDRYLTEVMDAKEYNFLQYYPVIIDIGANIGTFSLSMYHNADHIYALEPVQDNLDCLLQTIRDNNLDKITARRMAIGDKSWVQQMVRNGDPGMGGWHLGEEGDYPVDTRTLKDFMDAENIAYADLVKIDVEGMEEQILKTPFFPRDRVGTIIGEWHTGKEAWVKDLLTWHGYRYYPIPNSHFLARKI